RGTRLPGQKAGAKAGTGLAMSRVVVWERARRGVGGCGRRGPGGEIGDPLVETPAGPRIYPDCADRPRKLSGMTVGEATSTGVRSTSRGDRPRSPRPVRPPWRDFFRIRRQFDAGVLEGLTF